MANILSDAMYDYDNKIEFSIYEESLGGAIIVDGTTRYTISAYHIEIFNDTFRKYRKCGITMSVINNAFYITNAIGEVIYTKKISYNKPIEDEYNEIYSLIDNIHKGGTNERTV